jgi:1,4-dihydroxy-2-naphthoate polyprenyltransferase
MPLIHKFMHFLRKWIMVTRLETTMLSLASVGLGSALAAFTGIFDWRIGTLAAVTASLLQIICNIANDYGDLVHGADPMNKVKFPSAIQSGLVTLAQVRQVLPWLVGAAVGCGIFLLYMARLSWMSVAAFAVLGVLAIIAALTYTLGERPYGYQGWGDVAVFVFFGPIGVGGAFYLHTQLSGSIWLWPAIVCGSLAVGVLNVNNIRDLCADAQVGKNTIPVRIGRRAARCYHWCLIIVSIVAMLVFLLHHVAAPLPYACLCVVPFLLRHGIAVSYLRSDQLTEQLQHLVLIIVVFVALLSTGLVMPVDTQHMLLKTVNGLGIHAA